MVDAELGAGVELTATCWGMHVDLVEEKPGQPHLVAGSTITAIGGHNLLGLADEAHEGLWWARGCFAKCFNVVLQGTRVLLCAQLCQKRPRCTSTRPTHHPPTMSLVLQMKTAGDGPLQDAVATAFGEHFKHEALIDVDPATFETLELPPEASTWPLSFQEDLEMLANKLLSKMILGLGKG